MIDKKEEIEGEMGYEPMDPEHGSSKWWIWILIIVILLIIVAAIFFLGDSSGGNFIGDFSGNSAPSPPPLPE